ncbi:MAG: ImmA/IrrE family metallo-endopeptidase [Sphaerochaeta sp.]|nr:ImmA/IrrE family metallo-endopeptidase [Sphaerochaeta sp.]
MARPACLDMASRKKIELMVKERRSSIGGMDLPVANNLLAYCESLGIHIIQAPVSTSTDTGIPQFSALYHLSRSGGEAHHFIGLNTADYYDRQLFALAHELYHYFFASYHESEYRICMADDVSHIADREANYFASEFLLPSSKLVSLIHEWFDGDLSKEGIPTILRAIARVHVVWWLPYKAIVRKLLENNLIDEVLFDRLYAVDTRSPDGQYHRIASSIDGPVIDLLNCRTSILSLDAASLETIISNYHDGITEAEDLVETLRMFDKSPEDLGVTVMDETSDGEEYE